VWLFIAGLISETIYFVLAWRLSWWSYGGTLSSWSLLLGKDGYTFTVCLAGIGVLMAAYLWGWRSVRLWGGPRWILWGFACLFAATLFWLLPITSDLFTYLSQAHLFTDLKANPLLVASLDVNDPLLQAYPAEYAARPSVYGPGWLLISAPATLGRYDVAGGLSYLKGLALLAYLASAWLLERILKQVRPAAAVEGLYLFAWNPLVLLMAVGDGHHDIVMMAFVLLALLWLLRGRWALAFGALAFSVWIKYVSAFLFPFFVLYLWNRLGELAGRKRWLPLIRGGFAAAALSALLFLPFWDPASISGIVHRFVLPSNWRGGAGSLSSWTLALGLLLFVAACAILLYRTLQGDGSVQQWLNAIFGASLAAFVFGAARSQPWHLIWPAALAGLSDWRWAWPVVIGLSVAMLAVQVWVEWGAPGSTLFF
jgi:hypothetical protein